MRWSASSVPDGCRATDRGPLRRVLVSVWFAPAALMCLLGLWRIDVPQLWQDELVTIDVAGRTTGQILALLSRVDAVHGLYYLLIHGWTLIFGESVIAVRMPSVLAMTCATAFVALGAARLFDRRAGLLAGFVFALIPATSRYAQEARSYAIVVMLVALSTLLLLRAVEVPRLRRWAGYAVSIALIGVCNVVALPVLAGHAAVVLVACWPGRTDPPDHDSSQQARPRPAVPVRFLLAALAGLAATLPVLLLGSEQSQRQVGWIEHTPVWTVWPQLFSSARVAALMLPLIALAWWRPRPAAAATALAGLPLIAVWIASTGEINYFFSKYLLFVLPAVAMLAGAGLSRLRRPLPQAVALCLLAAAALPAQEAVRERFAHSWYTFPGPRVGIALGYAEAAEIISAGYQPGDAVVYGRVHWWLTVDLGVDYYLPDDRPLRDVFRVRSAAHDAELHTAECADAMECVGSEPRVWLVVPYQLGDPLQMVTSSQVAALTSKYRIAQIDHPTGMTVALLLRKPS